MTSNHIDASQRIAARVAGFTLLFAMAIVVFGNFYIAVNLMVPGDATQTARNILAHETLFRLNIACNLVYVVNVLVLLAALFVVFRPVSHGLALAAALFRLVYAIMWVVFALNMLDALRHLGDAPYLSAFDADQLRTLARLNLAGNFDAYYVGLPFFALASTVCSYLWFKSGYIPRILSSFGMISSAWCVFCSFAYIIFPNFNVTVNDWLFDTPMGLFEMTTGIWLLVKGLPPSNLPATGEGS